MTTTSFLPLIAFLVTAQAVLAPVLGLLRGSAGRGADDGLEPLLREIQRRRRLA
jgi:hypothetical protein